MKQFKLPKEFAEKWIIALRSSEYKQGHSMLLTITNEEECHYCCLGVAAKICGIPTEELHTEYINHAYDLIPDEIVGNVNNLPSFLSQLNDGISNSEYIEFIEGNEYEPFVFRTFDINQQFTLGEVKLNFNQIADFIEDNCEFYEL